METEEKKSKTPQASEDSLKEEKEKLIQFYTDQVLRTKAELENFRKRSEKAQAEAAHYGQARILKHFLPIWDQLILGLCQLKETASLDDKIKQGFEMVVKNLEDFFKSHGVSRVAAPLGAHYDPHYHEVVRVEDSEEADGTIVSVEQVGFLMGERVLRPARVVVTKKLNKGG